MIKKPVYVGLLIVIVAAAWLVPIPAVAQNEAPTGATDKDASGEPEYKPPLRGAPGGRVGGASRGTIKGTAPLPKIELLAPDGHTGLTASATPTLYFMVSQPISWPIQFTISVPLQPKPIVEVNVPAPRDAGVYGLRLTDYHVQLQPGVLYTWSVSVILNPGSRSRDIVASASLLRIAVDPMLGPPARATPASGRAGLLARAGLWYDAVAAAAETASAGQDATLRALMREVGLLEPAIYEPRLASGSQSR
jgi:Domain of Unknown Function (DUF928)